METSQPKSDNIDKHNALHLEQDKIKGLEEDKDSSSVDVSGKKSTIDLELDDEWSPPNSSKYKMFGYGRSMKEQTQDKKIYRSIESLTEGFKLTYNEVRDKIELQQGLLSKVNKHELIDIIKKGRQKYLRQQRQSKPKDHIEDKIITLGKRTSAEAQLPHNQITPQQRPKLDKKKYIEHGDISLAKLAIENFASLEEASKQKIINNIKDLIVEDNELYQDVLEVQVHEFKGRASYLYEERNYVELKILLSSLSPMAAILINLEIGKRNPQFMDEGFTLSYTMLPYINQTLDYSFISHDMIPLFNQYLASILRHLCDKQSSVQKGFLLFCMYLNPSSLHNIIQYENNQSTLLETFQYLGYNQECATIMSCNPSKFLWSELLSFFKGKLESMVTICVKIISKMDITSDPGPHMNNLIDFFAQRSILGDQLILKEKITINMPKLLIVLENLCLMESDAIVKCISQPSQEWEKFSSQLLHFKDLKEGPNHIERIVEIYKKNIIGSVEPISLEEICEVSQQLTQQGDEYRHNDYQCMIAACSLSLAKQFKIIVVPTGSGKTWIQGLIAMFYCLKGKQVTIIEPSEQLALQAANFLSTLNYGISVMTVEQFYQNGSDDDILILDEYDQILQQSQYYIYADQINGPWQFKGKTVYSFTATSSRSVERLVHKTIAPFDKLSFTSEYEFIHGITPLQDGHIKTSSSKEEMLAQLREVIIANYDQRPVIIIHDDSQMDEVLMVLKEERLKIRQGASKEVLLQIKDESYGVLLISMSESRGLDIKFAKSSIVLIIADVHTYSEYHQMLGRSSRTRDICEGILFTKTNEKPSIVIERLKKNEIAPLIDLEGLIPILEANAEDKNLIKILKKQLEKGITIKSTKKLEEIMGEGPYQKLKKNIKKQ